MFLALESSCENIVNCQKPLTKVRDSSSQSAPKKRQFGDIRNMGPAINLKHEPKNDTEK